jgi:hypothetical protein
MQRVGSFDRLTSFDRTDPAPPNSHSGGTEAGIRTMPSSANVSTLHADPAFPRRSSASAEATAELVVPQQMLEDLTALASIARSLAEVKGLLTTISSLPVPLRGPLLEALWARLDSLPVPSRKLAAELIVASTHDIIGTLSTKLWDLVTEAKLHAATKAAENGATVQEAVQRYGPADRSRIEREIVQRVAAPAISAGESVEAVVDRLGITNPQAIAGLQDHGAFMKAGGWSRFELPAKS